MFTMSGEYSKALITIDGLDRSCLRQIQGFLDHPAFTNPVAIMPDAHEGIGAVIGFTMRMADKIVPNVVGVDIGCGMLSFNIGKGALDSIDLADFDRKIRNGIPTGNNVHEWPVFSFAENFPWAALTDSAIAFKYEFDKRMGVQVKIPDFGVKWFEKKTDEIGINLRRAVASIGTLGGGNHFIEAGRDEDGNDWITIHSGSRNLGKQICEHHQRKAKKYCQKNSIHVSAELSYLEGRDAGEYLFDMLFAQEYAAVNRATMKAIIQNILGIKKCNEAIETIHNYIDFSDWMIRKGAIRSYTGEKMIIPFNMRDGILICSGRSNREWNNSAPHGAGRVLSRTEAKKVVSVKDFERSMEGIFSTSVCKSTVDESPMAYKDSALIEKAIEPTAEILYRIRPLYNLKDKDDGSVSWKAQREDKKLLKKNRTKKDRAEFKEELRKSVDDYLK